MCETREFEREKGPGSGYQQRQILDAAGKAADSTDPGPLHTIIDNIVFELSTKNPCLDMESRFILRQTPDGLVQELWTREGDADWEIETGETLGAVDIERGGPIVMKATIEFPITTEGGKFTYDLHQRMGPKE